MVEEPATAISPSPTALLPLPHSSMRHGPLVFASGFPDEERQVAVLQEVKPRRQLLLQGLEPCHRVPSFVFVASKPRGLFETQGLIN